MNELDKTSYIEETIVKQKIEPKEISFFHYYTFTITAGVLVYLIYVITTREMSESASNTIYLLVGTLSTLLGTCITWLFGSSVAKKITNQ